MGTDYLKTGRQVLRDEIEAMRRLDAILDESFERACRIIDACRGRVVFVGIGHSGHVAAKSASSFPAWEFSPSSCMPLKRCMASWARWPPGM
jgi:Predicted sugar phosphate isomerase involved in capsule formation